ncbi:thiosulfate/3-mercaptopyruvate sulfurtransferase 1 mitochondrial [Phtheirospermum japonicum]|uniref:Thiosulfate/3-mercaptopyruvate sulfurtransferase 1 mitochondrial n=1 Tax=Phtheirospermum japonicum TaxID=374723 RepID=A0A830BP38_9LAMI|nr:thiosulfate/3-mercaptopyruvate sulfurtransferase 1 mitochondrial [Phtheirospermum japonicum]
MSDIIQTRKLDHIRRHSREESTSKPFPVPSWFCYPQSTIKRPGPPASTSVLSKYPPLETKMKRRREERRTLTKAPLSVPVDGATLRRIFNVLGEPVDNLAVEPDVVPEGLGLAPTRAIGKNEVVLEIQNNIEEQTQPHVDARSKARFDGVAPEPRKGIRSGHVPGSKCVPFTSESRWTDIALSCGTGVTACILAMQEDMEETARAELWREELIEEIELKVDGLRELEEAGKREELVLCVSSIFKLSSSIDGGETALFILANHDPLFLDKSHARNF